MSYCRFSADGHRCDVYVYEDLSGGWTTHVAQRRTRFGVLPDLFSSPLLAQLTAWSGMRISMSKTGTVTYPSVWRRIVHEAALRLAILSYQVSRMVWRLTPLRPIGLPFDGEMFNDPTPGDCAARLADLRHLGYRVPQHVIDALLDEQAALDAKKEWQA